MEFISHFYYTVSDIGKNSSHIVSGPLVYRHALFIADRWGTSFPKAVTTTHPPFQESRPANLCMLQRSLDCFDDSQLNVWTASNEKNCVWYGRSTMAGLWSFLWGKLLSDAAAIKWWNKHMSPSTYLGVLAHYSMNATFIHIWLLLHQGNIHKIIVPNKTVQEMQENKTLYNRLKTHLKAISTGYHKSVLIQSSPM